VLGASNVTRGVTPLFAAARQAWGAPLEVLIAAGHGRSFGRTSHVLGRALPPIVDCELWADWKSRADAPTAALITDIGNDILYGVDVPVIAAWIDQCLERLCASTQHVVLVELPLQRIARLRRATFVLFRTLLFPRSRMTLEAARSGANQLNLQVRALARRHNCVLVEPHLDWYGVDPIHIQRRFYRRAWAMMLAGWSTRDELTNPVSNPAVDLRTGWALPWSRPHYQRLWGIERRCPQPAVRFADGSTASFY